MTLNKITTAIYSAVFVITVLGSYASAEEFGIELRGPNGAQKQDGNANHQQVRRASATVLNGSSNNSKKTNNSVNKAPTNKTTQNVKKEKSIDEICPKAKVYPEVVVPEAKIAKFDYEKTASVHEVQAGEAITSLVQYAQNDDRTLNEDQIYAALVRWNPNIYACGGLCAGASIKIPSEKQIGLEKPETGKKVRDAANRGTLKNLVLDELVLPWTEEEKIIEAAKAKKAERDELQKKEQERYDNCVAKENAKREQERKAREDKERAAFEVADLASPDMMIDDDTNETVTEDGKRVITMQDENKNRKAEKDTLEITQNGSSVSGSSLTLSGNNAVGKNSNGSAVSSNANAGKSTAEAEALKAKLSKLQDEFADYREKTADDIALLKQDIEQLKKNNEEVTQNLAEQSKSLGSGSEEQNDSSLLYVFASILVFLILGGIGGLAYLRIKQNKKRRELLLDDEDSIAELDTDQDVLGAVGDAKDHDENTTRQKEVSLNSGMTPEEEKKTESEVELGDLDESAFAASTDRKLPDLEKPDESIPDVPEQQVTSPDLVPSRAPIQAEPVVPTNVEVTSNPISPEPSPNPISGIDLSSEVKDVKPASDKDVMDEWAQALNEQKTEEAKPTSDKDVMDEWAQALNEQKTEEAKPASDKDVMDEWAQALNEQKTDKH